jgi:two-component system, NarL family, sensor kinase
MATGYQATRHFGGTGRRAVEKWLDSPRRQLSAFVLVALLVLGVIATGTIIAIERIARDTALDEAARTTQRLADYIVGPLLAEGDESDVRRVLANRVEGEALQTLVVWSVDGEILYSDREDLIGQRSEPSAELRSAAAGDVVAEVDDEPETSYQGVEAGPLLEVYAPITGSDPPRVLEAYFAYSTIDDQADRLRGQIIPWAVGGLVLLQFLQVPIAVSLVRRIQRQETERTALVERGLTASDRERRAIAADLHDGPVQDLAGISYALSGLRGSVPPERHPTVDRLVAAVRDAVDGLRRLMVDLYPPDLSSAGLGVALHTLAEPLVEQGIEVTITADRLPDADPRCLAVLYRTAKEALGNVASHARATHVWIELAADDLDGVAAARLVIADDGIGFPATGLYQRGDGHLGVTLVVDRVTDLGGTVSLEQRPGGGAMITALVPVDNGA